jgi:hypothetical protein
MTANSSNCDWFGEQRFVVLGLIASPAKTRIDAVPPDAMRRQNCVS